MNTATRIRKVLSTLVPAVFVLSVMPSIGHTQTTVTWDGSASQYLDVAANWTPEQLPDSNTIVSFDPTATIASGYTLSFLSDTGDISVKGINFSFGMPGDHSYTIVPLSTYTLLIGTGGIVNNGVPDQLISSGKLGLSSASTFTQNGMGTLSIASNIALGANTLTLDGYGPGTAVISGVISGTGGLTVSRSSSSDTWTLTGANLYTGSTTVKSGVLSLSLQAADTGVISSSSALIMQGGTLSVTGKNTATSTQTFSSTTFSSGGSTIYVNGNGGDLTTLALGTVSRSSGTTANFILQGNSSIAASTPDGTLGWATAGGTDWITMTSGVGSVATYTDDTWSAGNNTTVTTSSSPSSGSTTGTLRFNTAAANIVTLAGTNTISSGGILVTSVVGANASTITGGSLRGANGSDLVVFQNNTTSGGSLTIASSIVDNTSATGLTKAGQGSLHLTGVNNYTGNTVINSGAISFSGSNTSIGNVYVNSGGTLRIGANNTLPDTANLTLNGGSLALGGAYTDTLGTLTLTSGSMLNFANGGGGTLVFSDSSSNSWSGTLTIMNYAVGTSSLQFGSSSSGLTGSQLSNITFNGYTNSGAAQIDGSGFVLPTGTLTAVPEPSTYAVLAGLAALGLVIRRRWVGRVSARF